MFCLFLEVSGEIEICKGQSTTVLLCDGIAKSIVLNFGFERHCVGILNSEQRKNPSRRKRCRVF